MRDLIARALLLLLLLLLGGVAWLTRHPESRWLDRAADWPAIGPLAESFRAAYRPAPVGAPSEAPDGSEVEYVTVGPAARTSAAPDVEPLVEIYAPPAPPGPPPLGRQPAPVLPLPSRPASAAQLQAVEALLGNDAVETAIGPYAFLHAASLQPPVERWAALTATLDGAFAERFGVVPIGEPEETVALFADEKSYRELQNADRRLAGLDASGLASGGLAALYADGRSRQDLESTLVHELGHFLVRRALGPALPPWLDEGLAEDLAQTPFDGEELLFGTSRVDVEREGSGIVVRGALASLDEVDRAAREGRLPPLESLVALEWKPFVGAGAELYYGEALWWVRFLLDGGDAARAAAFRGHLESIATGGPADGERLRARLDAGWQELEGEFVAWIAAERERRLTALGLPSRMKRRP